MNGYNFAARSIPSDRIQVLPPECDEDLISLGFLRCWVNDCYKGEPGRDGRDSMELRVTATQTIAAGTLVAAIDGEYVPYDITNLAHATKLLGMALEDAGQGDELRLTLFGPVTVADWSLTPETIYRAGAAGQITPDEIDTAVFSHVVGYAFSPTTFIFRPFDPVLPVGDHDPDDADYQGITIAGAKALMQEFLDGGANISLTYDEDEDKLVIATTGLAPSATTDTTTTAAITDSTNKRFVTDAQRTILGNTSGTNTGDETQAGIKNKLGAASTSQDGYLTSTDWNTFNGKQNPIGYTPEDTANKATSLSGANNTTFPTTQAVATGLADKVDKVTGKGLSTEDYTTTEKSKLAGIASGATANDTDANLKNRTNHTGTQTASSISDFAATVRATLLTGLTAAASRVLPAATDDELTAWGKVLKWFTDLKAPAFADFGTTSGTVADGADSRITGAAQKSSNLSDLASPTTARTNLGLGSLATKSSVDLSGADATGTMATARMPALTGAITTTAGAVATSLASNIVTNANLAQIATATIKGRTTAGTGNVEDLSASQAKTLLALDQVDNTSDTAKNSATATLTNKTISGSSNTLTNIPLTSAVTGILPAANGGTGNGFTGFSGPASSGKTFTLPNANATILTDNAAVTIAQGGTGQTTANAALNALLPSQTGNSGKYLTTDGSGTTSWGTPAGGVTVLTKTNSTSTTQTLTFTSGAFTHHRHTTTGNTTFTFASVTGMDGEQLTLRVVIGSAGHTITINDVGGSALAAARWPTGAVPSFKTTANYVYIMSFIVDNASVRCTGITEYSS